MWYRQVDRALEIRRVGVVGGLGLVVGHLTPDQVRHPARSPRDDTALHQVLQLIEGRIPELLVGEQRIFVRKQVPPSLGSHATTPGIIPAQQRQRFSLPLVHTRTGDESP